MGPLSGSSVINTGLDSIDLSDERYRVSKSRPSDALYSSIAQHGVIDPPVLLRTPDKNIIVFGHNRLRVCAETAAARCGCIVVDDILPGWFIEYALLKNYHGEISPYGKIRLSMILGGMTGLPRDEALEILRTGFGVPQEYAAEPLRAHAVLSSAPAGLRDYLDCRDIGFKILGRVLLLPAQAHGMLAQWINAGPMKINVFKEAVELILDICRRDGSDIAASSTFSVNDREDGAVEDAIIRHLREVRYPHFAGLKKRAEALMAEIGRERVGITMPRHFEGDSVEVSLRFSKRDDAGEIVRRLSSVRADKIRALLDML
jgi:hypothetical protein